MRSKSCSTTVARERAPERGSFGIDFSEPGGEARLPLLPGQVFAQSDVLKQEADTPPDERLGFLRARVRPDERIPGVCA